MPNGLDWDKLKTFHAAAQHGSLTAAAESLNISQSAVSRQITALEQNWLTSVLPDFMETYPDIDVQLILEDSEHDLSAFDVDCALRPWPTTQGDVIERKLGQITQSIYASHSYLARHGAPTSAEDLDNHKIIAFGDLLPKNLHSANWLLSAGTDTPRKPVLSVNNLHGIMRAAEAGIGLAGIPDYMTVLSRRLVKVLPAVSGTAFDNFTVILSKMRKSVERSYRYAFLHTSFACLSVLKGVLILI